MDVESLQGIKGAIMDTACSHHVCALCDSFEVAGVNWSSTTTAGVSWSSAITAGVSWSSAITAGVSWSSTTMAGVSWSSTTMAGVSWSSTTTAGVSWSSTTTAGVSWSSTTTAGENTHHSILLLVIFLEGLIRHITYNTSEYSTQQLHMEKLLNKSTHTIYVYNMSIPFDRMSSRVRKFSVSRLQYIFIHQIQYVSLSPVFVGIWFSVVSQYGGIGGLPKHIVYIYSSIGCGLQKAPVPYYTSFYASPDMGVFTSIATTALTTDMYCGLVDGRVDTMGRVASGLSPLILEIYGQT